MKQSNIRIEGHLADELGSSFIEEIAIRIARRSGYITNLEVIGASEYHTGSIISSHRDGVQKEIN